MSGLRFSKHLEISLLNKDMEKSEKQLDLEYKSELQEEIEEAGNITQLEDMCSDFVIIIREFIEKKGLRLNESITPVNLYNFIINY